MDVLGALLVEDLVVVFSVDLVLSTDLGVLRVAVLDLVIVFLLLP